MRVALLGGSFNPPHLAHQLLCFWALSTARAEQVWLVPCDEHAFDKPLEPFAERHEMCRRACRVFPAGAVTVSPVETEIENGGRTLLTIEELQRRHPEHHFALMIGADVLAETGSWYRFDAIEQLVDVIVVGRPGYPSPPGAVELAPISSTAIRRRLAAGEDVSQLLPRPVLDHIRARGLYGARSAGAGR